MLKTATTRLVPTPAAAMLVTVWTPMDVAAPTLMNVLLTQTAALKTVKTLLVRTLVAAMLAIVSMLMGTAVMVSSNFEIDIILIFIVNTLAI